MDAKQKPATFERVIDRGLAGQLRAYLLVIIKAEPLVSVLNKDYTTL
jgi:hypothetical protein